MMLTVALYHRLKSIDVVVLKKLSEVVNVVPVIAKSDSLTIEERHSFKQRVSYDYKEALCAYQFQLR
jgi:septin family protein